VALAYLPCPFIVFVNLRHQGRKPDGGLWHISDLIRVYWGKVFRIFDKDTVAVRSSSADYRMLRCRNRVITFLFPPRVRVKYDRVNDKIVLAESRYMWTWKSKWSRLAPNSHPVETFHQNERSTSIFAEKQRSGTKRENILIFIEKWHTHVYR